MKRMKLVMVGNGMAGVRTLEELLKIAPELYDIAVFGAEPHPNYNRILLSPVLAGEQTIDEIILNSWEWYEQNNIRLHAGKADYVLVEVEPGNYKACPVRVGNPVPGAKSEKPRLIVEEGLRERDRVVSGGAILLKPVMVKALGTQEH